MLSYAPQTGLASRTNKLDSAAKLADCATMQTLKSVAPRYDVREDRLFLAINVGSEDARGYWLTRRLLLRALAQLKSYLDRTSELVVRTPAEYRSEVAVFERQKAVRTGQKSVGRLSGDQAEMPAARTELATELKLNPRRKGFLLEIIGRDGGQVRGVVSRTELETILSLMENEALKGGWLPPPNAPERSTHQKAPSGNKRRVN
jgi:hypothetical protein